MHLFARLGGGQYENRWGVVGASWDSPRGLAHIWFGWRGRGAGMSCDPWADPEFEMDGWAESDGVVVAWGEAPRPRAWQMQRAHTTPTSRGVSAVPPRPLRGNNAATRIPADLRGGITLTHNWWELHRHTVYNKT
eukprot:gene13270-biopygen6500